jgi:hypothetical protein
MQKKVIMPVAAAAVTATITWAAVGYAMKGVLDWISLLAFVVTFSAVFGFLWWRRSLRNGE